MLGKYFVVGLATAVLLATDGNSGAATIAYESFDYRSNVELDGLDGGIGFSDAWLQDAYSYNTLPGSLSDPTASLQTSGNSLRHSGLLPHAKRELSTALGATGTSCYVSVRTHRGILSTTIMTLVA